MCAGWSPAEWGRGEAAAWGERLGRWAGGLSGPSEPQQELPYLPEASGCCQGEACGLWPLAAYTSIYRCLSFLPQVVGMVADYEEYF